MRFLLFALPLIVLGYTVWMNAIVYRAGKAGKPWQAFISTAVLLGVLALSIVCATDLGRGYSVTHLGQLNGDKVYRICRQFDEGGAHYALFEELPGTLRGAPEGEFEKAHGPLRLVQIPFYERPFPSWQKYTILYLNYNYYVFHQCPGAPVGPGGR